MRYPQVREFALESIHLAQSVGTHRAIRVQPLTRASCSFSTSVCSSAAVKGRGCRVGPGPASVEESLVFATAGCGCDDENCGDSPVGVDDVVGLTALWFEGRILSEASAGSPEGITSFEDCRRAASGRGETGTELRSGIAASRSKRRVLVCWA